LNRLRSVWRHWEEALQWGAEAAIQVIPQAGVFRFFLDCRLGLIPGPPRNDIQHHLIQKVAPDLKHFNAPLGQCWFFEFFHNKFRIYLAFLFGVSNQGETILPSKI
jgi:hypothetical protein